jgi:hypothetical protein
MNGWSAIAERQYGIVTREQLRSVMTDRQIHTLLKRGSLMKYDRQRGGGRSASNTCERARVRRPRAGRVRTLVAVIAHPADIVLQP